MLPAWLVECRPRPFGLRPCIDVVSLWLEYICEASPLHEDNLGASTLFCCPTVETLCRMMETAVGRIQSVKVQLSPSILLTTIRARSDHPPAV